MEITASKVSVSVAILIAIMCSAHADYMAYPRMGRSGEYLAFPRMGRSGYIAFPRMGRSNVKSETTTGCCGVGLKEEFLLGQEGKEELRSICSIVNGECCIGLREIIDERPDGYYYSMCVPDIPAGTKSVVQSSTLLNKLKRMLRK